jgi:hypothetical protein
MKTLATVKTQPTDFQIVTFSITNYIIKIYRKYQFLQLTT